MLLSLVALPAQAGRYSYATQQSSAVSGKRGAKTVARTGFVDFSHVPAYSPAPLDVRTAELDRPRLDLGYLTSRRPAEKAQPKKATGRPRAPAFDHERRALLGSYGRDEHGHVGVELYDLLKPSRLEIPRDDRVHVDYRERHGMFVSHRGAEAVSTALDLDPNRKLLSAADWETMRKNYPGERVALVENPGEHIRFYVKDQFAGEHALVTVEEKLRGALAKRLADALAHEKASPDKLAEVTARLAEEHPFLGNPWKVEMLIADMRRVHPTLGAWDFRTHTDGKRFRAPRQLPPSTQALVSRVGYRALADSPVVMTTHLYRDSLVMSDALEALGADPDDMHFVATPYPFDPRVEKALAGRGVSVKSAPYDKEKTREQVVHALEHALGSSKSGPILVFDDGGLATEVIAKKFKSDLHRFRIVEITKAGERVGKAVLEDAIEEHYAVPADLTRAAREELKRRFVEARSWDPASRAAAEQEWGERVASKPPASESRYDRAAESYGFSYTTYSNTAYKRDVMTPFYTEQVNRSMFDAIERSGNKTINNRISIIGGGAMGLAAARELRDKGHQITFVEPDAGRAADLRQQGFEVAPLAAALPGRGIILDMSGAKNIISLDQIFRIDDGAFVLHGSSKDNPFDMKSIKAIASHVEPLQEHHGQRSATYTFSAAGRQKRLHFLGDGFTISHGGKAQNVPLKQFVPELDALLNVGIHAVEQEPEATRYPFYTATEAVMHPAAQ